MAKTRFKTIGWNGADAQWGILPSQATRKSEGGTCGVTHFVLPSHRKSNNYVVPWWWWWWWWWRWRWRWLWWRRWCWWWDTYYIMLLLCFAFQSASWNSLPVFSCYLGSAFELRPGPAWQRSSNPTVKNWRICNLAMSWNCWKDLARPGDRIS